MHTYPVAPTGHGQCARNNAPSQCSNPPPTEFPHRLTALAAPQHAMQPRSRAAPSARCAWTIRRRRPGQRETSVEVPQIAQRLAPRLLHQRRLRDGACRHRPLVRCSNVVGDEGELRSRRCSKLRFARTETRSRPRRLRRRTAPSSPRYSSSRTVAGSQQRRWPELAALDGAVLRLVQEARCCRSLEER